MAEERHAPSIDQARDDLAYLSSIMSERTPSLYNAGFLYCAAGLLYGLQCLIAWANLALQLELPTLVHLINGFLPTVIFLAMCVVVSRRSKVKGYGKSFTSRALSGVFGGAGLANFALIIVFALAAFRRDDFTIWLFYPVTVCALQGAVWYGVAVIRRRWWMGAVAIGWMLAAVLASLFIQAPQTYVMVMGLSLFVLMGIPGYVLMKVSSKQEASA